jgi:hypothetical protein
MILLFPGRGMMEKMARQKKGCLTGGGSGKIAGKYGECSLAHKIAQR